MKRIELKNVGVVFKGRPVLHDVSFTLQAGDICQIAGPNGSGKSTILKLIAGLLVPTTGQVLLDDTELTPGKFIQRAGVMINEPEFIGHLTGMANLMLLAQIQQRVGRDEVAAWMRRFGLDPDDRIKVRNYSLGMKQKLGIIQVLMEKPAVIMLDEPLNGLDRQSKAQVVALLREIHVADPNIMMILISHEDEIKPLVNRAFVVDGETVVEDDA